MSDNSTSAVTSSAAPSTGNPGSKPRGVVAWVLVVIAAVLMPLALVAFWGQRTLTNTAEYVATVAPLVEEQVVQDAIVTKTTTTLMTTIEDNKVVEEVLDALPPAAVAKLKPAIEGAIESLVTQVSTKIVTSDQFYDFWVGANQRLQQALISALSGNPDGAVTIEGDEVVLDTEPLAKEVQAALVQRGLTALEGKPLPAAADQRIVLLSSKELAQARTIYAFTVPLARYLIPVLAVLVLVAVAVSTRRARIVMGIGIGVAIGMAALGFGLGFAKTVLASAAPTTAAQSLLDVFWVTLTRYLTTAVWAWLAAGVVVAVLGWFGGRSGPATAVRSAVSSSLRNAGAKVGAGSSSGVGDFLESHWRAVFIAIGVVGTASLFAFTPVTVGVVLSVSAVCLVLAALVTFLRGLGGAPAAAAGSSDAPATGAAPTTA